MKQWLITGVIISALIVICAFQQQAIIDLRSERNIYRSNTDILLSDIEFYKTKDSLNVARVGSLELTLKEFKRYREEDLKLIKSLRSKNRDLASVTKSQSATIVELQSRARDTIVIRDSLPVRAKLLECSDQWYRFHGILADDILTGTMESYDSLVVVESVKYKRFLGFLWKTKKIKDRQVEVVSKNPYTHIQDVELVTIRK